MTDSSPSKRIADIHAAATAERKQVLSFEIFPPKGDLTLEAARSVAHDLAALEPRFISVTYSAGGSATAGSGNGATNRISALIQDEFDVTTMAHLTCVGSTRESLHQVCDDIAGLGIQNVLALRGDLPDGVEPTEFKLARDLIPLAKEHGLCVGAAAYPEGHVTCFSDDDNIEHLKQKQDAGADFFITQLFFDNSCYYRFWERAQKAGITAPISCGIMPFMSKSQIQRMVFMCGASLPAPIIKLLGKYENDEQSLMQAGIEYAVQQLVDLDAHGVEGLHLYTMNRPAVATQIVNALRDSGIDFA